ncbi:MAG: tetratricopeptide repeat protein [Acidobacteriota bacterium]
MKVRVAWCLIWFAIVMACAKAPEDVPEATSSDTPTSTTASELLPIPDIDTTQLAPDLAARLEERRRALDAASTAEAHGELGRLAHAYDLAFLARPAYENATRLAPDEPLWPHLLGHLERQRGDLQAAARAFERVIEHAPDDRLARTQLARAYLDLGRDDDAESVLRDILSTDPNDAAALAAIGRIAARRGRWGDAAAFWETALEAAPGATSLHIELQGAYAQLGDDTKARFHFGRAGRGQIPVADPRLDAVRALRDDDLGNLRARAAAALGADQLDQAIDGYEAVLERAPDDADAWQDLAQAKARRGDSDAFDTYARAVELRPDNPRLLFDYGSRLGNAGQPAAAIPLLERAVALAPEFPEAHHNLGSALARLGRLDEAEAAFTRVIDLDPRHDGARHLRAVVLTELDRHAEAIDMWRGVIERNPAWLEPRLRLADALSEENELTAAIQQLRAVVERAPNRAITWANLGILLEDNGDTEQALDAYRRALMADPNLHPATRRLIALLVGQGQCDEAARVLETLPRAQRGDATSQVSGCVG